MLLSKMKLFILMAIAIVQLNCNAQHILKSEAIKVEILDDKLLQLLDPNAQVDVLAEGLG